MITITVKMLNIKDGKLVEFDRYHVQFPDGATSREITERFKDLLQYAECIEVWTSTHIIMMTLNWQEKPEPVVSRERANGEEPSNTLPEYSLDLISGEHWQY